METNAKKPSVCDLFITSLVKSCSESTSHGLPNVFRTPNWLIRLMWLLLFSVGASVGIYCKNKKRIKMFTLYMLKH